MIHLKASAIYLISDSEKFLHCFAFQAEFAPFVDEAAFLNDAAAAGEGDFFVFPGDEADGDQSFKDSVPPEAEGSAEFFRAAEGIPPGDGAGQGPCRAGKRSQGGGGVEEGHQFGNGMGISKGEFQQGLEVDQVTEVQNLARSPLQASEALEFCQKRFGYEFVFADFLGIDLENVAFVRFCGSGQGHGFEFRVFERKKGFGGGTEKSRGPVPPAEGVEVGRECGEAAAEGTRVAGFEGSGLNDDRDGFLELAGLDGFGCF